MSRMSVKKKKAEAKVSGAKAQIIIDEKRGLIFSSEEKLYAHFQDEIDSLEKEFFDLREEDDIPTEEFKDYEELLGTLLETPDEVWESEEILKTQDIMTYIGHFDFGDEPVYYVSLAYMCNDTPSFVFLHFPTKDEKLVESYRRGSLVYSGVAKEVEKGAFEGDALTEGDGLAVGLYKAMLKLRNKKDMAEDDFQDFAELREETIEEPDELWRTQDFQGNTLVNFIKEFDDYEDGDVFYIVVTLEDTPSNSHALLFSFPTNDKNLVDRYRQGENLQAEEVVQESSH